MIKRHGLRITIQPTDFSRRVLIIFSSAREIL
nr:MAG TPA: hypothetical protein [Caudoviricetes sp.]